MHSRTRVYVSGPYTSDPEGNTTRAIAAGQTLLNMGYAPFVPHLTHFWHLQHENHYEVWLDLDLAYVATCRALLRMPGHSPGADREVEAAETLGIPVYHSISELFDEVPAFSVVKAAELGSVPAPVEEALRTIRDIFAKKNADYADGRRWDSNFADVAAQMGWDSPQEAAEALIAVKQARLRSLRTTGNTPQNEAVADTRLDRAVYGVISLAIDLEAAKQGEQQ